MTKTEKEKLKKTQARLEAMKAAGLIVGGMDSNSTNTEKTKVVYSNKKKQTNNQQAQNVMEDVSTTEDKNEEEEEVKSPVQDNSNDDDDDDWETAEVDVLSAKLQESVKLSKQENVEDFLENEKKNEFERMRQLGLERARREEEARIKK